METKHTILTRKDMALLEDIIVQHGRIVSFTQIHKLFKKDYSAAGAKNRIAHLAKLGWLFRIKKGFYIVVTDIGSLSLGNISHYTIAQALNKDSYISFENALQHHGMFDQMLSSTGSITYKRSREYKIVDAEIKFYKIKKELYFGFKKERSDIGSVHIACKEKAILDILYFRSNDYYMSLVWEKLKNYKNDMDFSLLKKYTKKFNLTIIRQVGFFLDRLGIEAKDLLGLVHGKTSYGKMTNDSKEFNAKWRLYFDSRIIE